MFTLQFQYADMAPGEAYLVGDVTSEEAQQQFESFPWADQLKKFQDQHLHAPTYRLKNRKRQDELLVSVITEDNFYVSLTARPIKKTFGLFPVKTQESYSGYGLDFAEVTHALRAFLDDDANAIKAKLATAVQPES